MWRALLVNKGKWSNWICCVSPGSRSIEIPLQAVQINTLSLLSSSYRRSQKNVLAMWWKKKVLEIISAPSERVWWNAHTIFSPRNCQLLASDNWSLVTTQDRKKWWLNSIYGFAEQALLIQSLPQIVNSCVVIKHQLSLAKVGNFLEKKGMGISPNPLGGGAYNLQSISTTPERRFCKDKTRGEPRDHL